MLGSYMKPESSFFSSSMVEASGLGQAEMKETDVTTVQCACVDFMLCVAIVLPLKILHFVKIGITMIQCFINVCSRGLHYKRKISSTDLTLGLII